MAQSDQACFPPKGGAGEYSAEERRLLLDLAHRSIEAQLRGERVHVVPPNEHLAEKRGAFTTLHLGARLRGCIGYVAPMLPLVETIAATAAAAAFEDPRFDPVDETEAPHLNIEISVLTVPKAISPEEVVVGRHGLIIGQYGRRGLLLPQVPLEYGWDRETFLAQTCVKAGLPPDAWRQGATVEAFTAEVFGELEGEN
jgi:AmmeMemoRadiSam system protein A